MYYVCTMVLWYDFCTINLYGTVVCIYRYRIHVVQYSTWRLGNDTLRTSRLHANYTVERTTVQVHCRFCYVYIHPLHMYCGTYDADGTRWDSRQVGDRWSIILYYAVPSGLVPAFHLG